MQRCNTAAERGRLPRDTRAGRIASATQQADRSSWRGLAASIISTRGILAQLGRYLGAGMLMSLTPSIAQL